MVNQLYIVEMSDHHNTNIATLMGLIKIGDTIILTDWFSIRLNCPSPR